VLEAVPLEEHLPGRDVELLGYAVQHNAVCRAAHRGEVHRHLVVDRDQRNAFGRDQELVVVARVAVPRSEPPHLPVGAVEDDVLALAVAGVVADPPGEHRLAPVPLHLEVHHVQILVLQEAQPHGLSVVVEDHASVLPRTVLLGSVLRGDEDAARSGIARRRTHRNDRRAEVRARAGAPRLPHGGRCGGRPGADSRVASQGTGERPHAAPKAAACRNLRRVTLRFNLLPLARSCPGFFGAQLSGVTLGTPFSVALRLRGCCSPPRFPAAVRDPLDPYPTTRLTSRPGT
jgi:hypothetical protein